MLELNRLKILELSCSPMITKLPIGIEILVELRALALSHIHALHHFPVQLLRSCKFLENLALIGLKNCNAKDFLHVIRNLNLSVHEVNFRTSKEFDCYVKLHKWKELSMFRIFVGHPPEFFMVILFIPIRNEVTKHQLHHVRTSTF